jgi:hypothetical protein
MVNSAYYGDMRTDPSLKAEFTQECLTLDRHS